MYKPIINVRKQLHELTENHPLAQHIELMNQYRDNGLHSIVLVDTLDAKALPYNCFMYAIDIKSVDSFAKLYRSHWPDSSFMNYLIDKGLIKMHSGGEIVLYFEQGKLKHAGKRLKNGRILSKWGTGHVWEHEVFEVPISYGNDVKYASVARKQQIVNAFIEYTKN